MYKVNISIDDVSPHPKSSVKVVDTCFEIIKEYPEAKFTLFVPVAYWRTRGHTATEKPLVLNEHREFCEILKLLPKTNFEIGYHGLLHGIPGISNNDEFQNLNYEQAKQKFEMMFEIVHLANLENIFKPIFRPPAWRMSAEAIKAAKDLNIEILALSPKQYAKDIYQGEDETFGNVIYYNVNPPLDPLQLFEKTEIVYHACEWDQNFLNMQKAKELNNFLKNKEVTFNFMEDLLDGNG